MRTSALLVFCAAACLSACMDHGAHDAAHGDAADAGTSMHGGHDSMHTGDAGQVSAPVPEVIEVPATQGPFDATTAVDLDPAADVAEVALEAKETDVEVAAGKKVRMWTYGGTLPGPTTADRCDRRREIRTDHRSKRVGRVAEVHWLETQ